MPEFTEQDAAELARLKAAMPMTEDGVMIVPGMTVFVHYVATPGTQWVRDKVVCAVDSARLYKLSGDSVFCGLPCYSKLKLANEALSAARAAAKQIGGAE